MSIDFSANKENVRPVLEGSVNRSEGAKAKIPDEEGFKLAPPMVPLQLKAAETLSQKDQDEEKSFELARPVTPPGMYYYSMSTLEEELDAQAGLRTPERKESPRRAQDLLKTPSPYKVGLHCLSSHKRTPSKVSPNSAGKIVGGYESLRAERLDPEKLRALNARYQDMFSKFLAKDAPEVSPLAHQRSVAYARSHDWIEDLLDQFHRYSITSIVLFDIEHIVVGERAEKEGVGKLSGKHFFTPVEFQQMVVSHVTSTQGVTTVRWRQEPTDKIKASSIFSEGYTPEVFLKSFRKDAPIYTQNNRKVWSIDGMWVETYHRGFYIRSAFPIFFHTVLERGKQYEFAQGKTRSSEEILAIIEQQCVQAFSGAGTQNPIQFYNDETKVCVFDICPQLDIDVDKGVYIEVPKAWVVSKDMSAEDIEELIEEL